MMDFEINYVRILGFDKKGQEYLKKIRENNNFEGYFYPETYIFSDKTLLNYFEKSNFKLDTVYIDKEEYNKILSIKLRMLIQKLEINL